jgi:hypothetical protein
LLKLELGFFSVVLCGLGSLVVAFLGQGWNPTGMMSKKFFVDMKKFHRKTTTLLQHILAKMGDMEQAIANVMNLLTIQTQRIDGLEIDCQYLRTLVLPQCSNSTSINQGATVSHHGGNSNNDLGGCDTTPMEVEEGSLLPGREQDVQDNESFH